MFDISIYLFTIHEGVRILIKILWFSDYAVGLVPIHHRIGNHCCRDRLRCMPSPYVPPHQYVVSFSGNFTRSQCELSFQSTVHVDHGVS